MVIGHGCEAVRDMVGSDAIFVLQEKQLGTGHALSTAREAVSGASNIVVLYGDHPFVSSNAISDVVSLREQTGAPIAMMTTIVPDWHDWRFVFRCWGRILRDQNNKIVGIREWKDANDKEKEIKELNPGLYCFESGWLWKNIDGLECNNAQNEYYITDLVSMAVGQGHKIQSLFLPPEHSVGVNTKEELEIAERICSGLEKTKVKNGHSFEGDAPFPYIL